MTPTARKRSPLESLHHRLGARLVDFAGWSMPLQYDGVIAEHEAVRTAAGVFDVSHLGKLRIQGLDGGQALQRALTCDVLALDPGRARYGLALADDGGTLDDLFVYRLEKEWLVVPNAANVDVVAGSIRECGGSPVDEWQQWAIIALQGPRSFDLFEAVFPGSQATALKLHRFCVLDVFGEEGLVARTGYTGERGFEIYAPARTAEAAFEALVEAGAKPAGLGARDTLRLEMGYALYGHELDRDINPLEAGLSWAIAWETGFRGKESLERIRREGPRRRLFGVRLTERGVPRQGYPVTRDGRGIGSITSGNFSPTLKTGIALALGRSGEISEPGDKVQVHARGRSMEGAIVEPPFVKRGRG